METQPYTHADLENTERKVTKQGLFVVLSHKILWVEELDLERHQKRLKMRGLNRLLGKYLKDIAVLERIQSLTEPL